MITSIIKNTNSKIIPAGTLMGYKLDKPIGYYILTTQTIEASHQYIKGVIIAANQDSFYKIGFVSSTFERDAFVEVILPITIKFDN